MTILSLRNEVSRDMPSLKEQLRQAHRHVEEATRRVADQTALIERLKADGHDTGPAKLLLAAFLQALDVVTRHLAELESSPPR